MTRASSRRWLAGAAVLAGALAAFAGSPYRSSRNVAEPAADRRHARAATPAETTVIPVDAAARPIDAAVTTWRRGC
jgi:hypothetical protein